MSEQRHRASQSSSGHDDTGMEADPDSANKPEASDQPPKPSSASSPPSTPNVARSTQRPSQENLDDDDDDDDEEEDEDEEDTEPCLKYTKLTGNIASVYRNGDSTSTSLAIGDKLILGSRDGNVSVISVPSLETLRQYHAHSASITNLSVSPFPQPHSLSGGPSTAETTTKTRPQPRHTPTNSTSAGSPKAKSPRKFVPPTPSNSIYIGTASLDGQVCVTSLVDPNDVTLRNFARPVHAVALSPDFKNDRTYLSGGTAGHLILTTGGKPGTSADANTNSAAAAASGWLGSLGLSSNTGRDTRLHSDEGSISSIEWSLSGKYVAWVNEHGIRIMRSSLHLDSPDADGAWKRLAFIEKPNSKAWEDAGGAWTARMQWVDRKALEAASATDPTTNGVQTKSAGPVDAVQSPGNPSNISEVTEQLLVGWGDTVWVIHVRPGGASTAPPKSAGPKSFGKPEIIYTFKFPDGIISGLSLYTPSTLLTLIYRTRDDNDKPISTATDNTPRRGIRRRENGLPPDLRLIDLDAPGKDELEVVSLSVSRFAELSFADYQLTTLSMYHPPNTSSKQRGALSGWGDGLWDVGVNATRLFSSSASVLSGSSGDDRQSVSTGQTATQKEPAPVEAARPAVSALSQPGMKVFILSPFDCLVAVKRDSSDHLEWLKDQGQYEEAWRLIDEHPEIVKSNQQPDSRPATPTRGGHDLADFLADDASSEHIQAAGGTTSFAATREKQQIGDKWLQQLVDVNDWAKAGEIAAQVVTTAIGWDRWISIFAEADKFDEIAPSIPSNRLRPPIASTFYESVLDHYVHKNRAQLIKLLNRWDPQLYDATNVIAAVESELENGEVREDTTEEGEKGHDWRILEDALAQLYLSDARPAEALKCYLRTKNAAQVLQLVEDEQLIATVSDNLWPFITVELSSDQLESAPLSELDEKSSRAIHLLAMATLQGLVTVSQVVSQLQPRGPSADPFLFFFFRTLWNGEAEKPTTGEKPAAPSASRRARFATSQPTNTSRVLLTSHADLAVSLFAEYSRPLLSSLLRSSDADDTTGGTIPYTFEHASAVCEARGYIPELVDLLAATGQIRRALHLIIDELGDVRRSIEFAKDVDDAGLWRDLLDYSLDKPAFIRGLLEEVSVGMGAEAEPAAIDPVDLVRRIPDGLEIPGLKTGLARILRDSDVQCSIAEGASRVLRGEISQSLGQLVRGRARGVAFDVDVNDRPGTSGSSRSAPKSPSRAQKQSRHRCALCDEPYAPPASGFSPDDEEKASQDHLIGYTCGHIYHLQCVMDALTTSENRSSINDLQARLEASMREEDHDRHVGRVGGKISRMQMIGSIIAAKGCLRCTKQKEERGVEA